MRPQFGATSPAALVNAMRPDGTAKFGRLRTLNASRRTCSVFEDGNANDLMRDRSTLIRPGPVSVLRPRFPRVPAAGSANALISQYRSGPPSTGLLEKPGFKSGRSFIEKPVVFRFPERLKPRRTVNGWPVWNVVTLFSCHPLSNLAATPVSDAAAGTSQLALSVTLCL